MNKAILIMLTIGLCACASNPRYVQADDPGEYGWHESQLSDTRYRVTYSGNRSTPRDTVKDFALRRAAELTLLNGHDWFRVVTEDTDHESRSYPETQTAISTAPQVQRDCGLLGCRTTVTPAYTGVAVIATRSASKYVSSIEIVMGDGKAEDPTTVYDAKEIRDFLETRY